jgi:serine/threonine protein kinase
MTFMCDLYFLDYFSSAKDQLTGMNVAIKKIMKPFSAPVLAKRTYRELKLLKALRHENVSHLLGKKLGGWVGCSLCTVVGSTMPLF